MRTGPSIIDLDRPTWRSRAWLVAVVVPLVLLLGLATVGVRGAAAAWFLLITALAVTGLAVTWALNRTRVQRKRFLDELAAWAAERAAQAERLRIAGELHDLVSHGLGLITVRAAAARSVGGPEGEHERADALADIERTSRETTTELRRMLAVLRTPGQAPVRPADTLDDLPAIVGNTVALGVDTALDIGDLGEVSPGVQLTICAVVREALNNTVRHCGPTQVRIGIRRDRHALVVDVRDAGPRPGWRAQQGAGHGIANLRRRVSTVGGVLHAEPEAGGFRVTARIPDPQPS